MTLQNLLEHEIALRLAPFLLALAAIWVAQRRWPVRGDGRPAPRQLRNLVLAAIDAAAVRLILPLVTVVLALDMQARGQGLLNLLQAPVWLALPATLLLLDLGMYWQHRLMHQVPLLWRLHRVHHSDLGLDLTTGLRFHPLEMLLLIGVKVVLVVVLGADPVGVLVFELLLSVSALVTHSDLALPPRADRAVRRLLVTPSMHRIHHSIRPLESNSNYGAHLSLWDRLFGSYRAQPLGDPRSMPIGVEAFRAPAQQTVLALLANPFRGVPASPPGAAEAGKARG